jgi:hypothetical protein
MIITTATQACTLEETYGTTDDANSSVHNASGAQKGGFDFDTTSAYILTKMEISTYYGQGGDGTPEGTITPYLCADSSGEPACADSTCSVCTAGTPVATTSLPTGSPTYYGFIFSGYSLSATTKYWLVLSNTEYGDDEWISIRHDTSGESNEKDVDTDPAASWSQQYSNVQILMKGYYGSCS